MKLKDYLGNCMIDNIDFTINIFIMTGRQSMLGKFEGPSITIELSNSTPCTLDPLKMISDELLNQEIVFIKILKDELRFYVKGSPFKTGIIMGE